MGKRGGEKKQPKNSGLGGALRNQERARNGPMSNLHTADFLEEFKGQQSVVDAGDFEELVTRAMAEEREFCTRTDAKLVTDEDMQVKAEPTAPQLSYMASRQNLLRIPRRPPWSVGMTKEALAAKEQESFYVWRSELAKLEQEGVATVTPFEKNLEIWRQLWRVVERSDVLCQIIDARNPLLFRSRDLERYIAEISLRQRRQMVPAREEPAEQAGQMGQTGARQAKKTITPSTPMVPLKPAGYMKSTLLILNKADMVPVQARKLWADYFDAFGIKYVWFSALWEEQKIQQAVRAASGASGGVSGADGAGDNAAVDTAASAGAASGATPAAAPDAALLGQAVTEQVEDPRLRLVTRLELLEILQSYASRYSAAPEVPGAADRAEQADHTAQAGQADSSVPADRPRQAVTVGTVGYPNVGKSSLINVLAIETGVRTAVGSTPGKTKHFQTIQLNQSIILCDCPGLIFPSFSHCRADLVCNGILNINTERQYLDPIRLLAARIPVRVFEKVYGVSFPPLDKFSVKHIPQGINPNETYSTAEQICDVIAEKHGYTQSYGGTDRTKVSRMIIRDLFNGRLLWVTLPPPIPSAAEREARLREFLRKRQEQKAQAAEVADPVSDQGDATADVESDGDA